ncbi:MAG: OmpA family protein, partial [Bacteroidaceae bacterium]|nr:OmpA family protein [Bacteroidaceae bacterium]
EMVEGGLNTDFDEGACSFSPDGKTMYLTVCRTDPQYPRMAEIWTSQRSEAAWGKPTQLKITGDTLSSFAHPAVSPDGRFLYFVSDMPGGYGGLDLWRASISGGHGVGVIENLGESINTSGDEMFPAFRPSGELYFSSTGRVGMGGLDLYRATEDTVMHRWEVKHLPSPMNSQGDDFGITFEGLYNRGYFSSNRTTGGRGWDKLFSFSYPEILQTVKGWVYEQDGYELPGAQVYMVGDDGTNLKLSVRSDGSFEQPLTPGVNYLFLATCKGYLNYRGELRADSLEEEHQYVLQFPLPSISIPVLVRNVFYEFDKADLTDNSREALDRLTALLKENPHVTIELGAHCDLRGNDDYNLRLSQRRAESVVRYLTEHGIAADRLTPRGYGETVPKIVNKKLTEAHPFLHEGDTLTEAYILKLTPEQQEICHALNRRTEFRVLRTTYGLFDEEGNLKPEALKPENEDE